MTTYSPSWVAETRLMEACDVDPRRVVAEPLKFDGDRVTFREVQTDAEGDARIGRDGVKTRTRTVRAPADALARFRQEATR